MRNMPDAAARLMRMVERYTRTDIGYLASTGFWMNLGWLFVSLASLGLYIIFANVLSKEVYGTYQYLLSLAAIVGGFTLTGMNSAITHAVARGYEGTVAQSIRIQLIWGAVLFLGMSAVGCYYLLNGNTTLGIGSFAIGSLVPLSNAFNTHSALLQGRRDFRRGFLYTLALGIPYYGSLALTAFFIRDPLALLLAGLLSNAILTILIYRAVVRTVPCEAPADPSALGYGKHLSLMGALGVFASQADNILIFHYLGAAELALYSFATAIPDRLLGLFKFIPAAALPKFSADASGTAKAVLARKLWLLGALALAGACTYMLAAPLVFRFLFPEYQGAVPFSQLYSLSLLATVGGVSLSALTALRARSSLYLFSVITPLLQLALQFILVLTGGLWGVIVAKTVSNLISPALSTLLLFGGNGRPGSPPTAAGTPVRPRE